MHSPWSRSLQTAIWRREWSKLYRLVEAELPAQAAERIANPPTFTDPDEARLELEVVLLSWALPDFAYLEALNSWLGKSVFLEPDTPYPWLSRWPGDLKPPPAEPPALWNELLLCLRQPNPDGFVAAALLQLMATARAVVRYRERLPQ